MSICETAKPIELKKSRVNGGSNYDSMTLSKKAEPIELKFCGKLPHGPEMS